MSKKKDCLFQYATKHKTIVDSDLITRKEADELYEKYLPDIKSRWGESEAPEMGIWINCKNNIDYHTTIKHICYHDGECKLEDGTFFRVTKTIIK